MVETIIGHLSGLGHKRIARVGGLARYWHTALRAEAFGCVEDAAYPLQEFGAVHCLHLCTIKHRGHNAGRSTGTFTKVSKN